LTDGRGEQKNLNSRRSS